MKKISSILFLIIALVSCKEKEKLLLPKDTNTVFDSVAIQLHDTKCNSILDYCFSLDAIVHDSRCPKTVMCIWEGTAIAQFTFTHHSQIHTFNLEVKKDTLIDNYKIHFLELLPNPQVDTFVYIYNAIIEIKHQ